VSRDGQKFQRNSSRTERKALSRHCRSMRQQPLSNSSSTPMPGKAASR
jgi:hypothetical protein